MKGEQGIIASIIILSALGVVGVVGVLATGGETSTALAVFGFTAPTIAALLALLKSQQAKTQTQEMRATMPQQVSDKVEEVMADKTVISTDDLPPSLGGNSK